MTQSKTAASIIRNAEETLATARMGLEDVLSRDPKRRLPGLRNLIVFGRAVTNVVQNLRSVDAQFDSWYQPRVAEMRSDPLLRFVYELRTEILKRGSMPTSAGVHVSHFEFPRDLQKLGAPPPNARGFFIGDQTGGSGWEIALEDGGVEKFYVDMPTDQVTAWVELRDAPMEHLGASLPNRHVQTVAQAYFDYLSGLVSEARKQFGLPKQEPGA